jgi:predicted DNA-binding transcriptional regulator YafY
MTRQGRAITLSLKEPEKEALQLIATELGYTWGEKPNISKLVEAIAQRKLLIAQNNDWSQDLIATLHQAAVCLRDQGDSKNAQAIAELLLNRSELKNPARREIERLLETTQKNRWRDLLDEFIDEEKSFQLSYQDAAQRIWTLNIQFAEIVRRDRREYLDCWCKETSDTDLSKLRNNWGLRLDWISDAAISPIKAKWRSGLDSLEVELHFSGSMAFGYEGHDADISNEWHPQKPQVRRVIRKISSTSCLFQELLPLAEECEIVSPMEVRDRFQQKLRKLAARYS